MLSKNTISVSEIRLFQILKPRPGDQVAEDLVCYINEKARNDIKDANLDFASKSVITRLDDAIKVVDDRIYR